MPFTTWWDFSCRCTGDDGCGVGVPETEVIIADSDQVQRVTSSPSSSSDAVFRTLTSIRRDGVDRWSQQLDEPISLEATLAESDETSECGLNAGGGGMVMDAEATTASTCPTLSPKHAVSSFSSDSAKKDVTSEEAAVVPGPLERELPSNCKLSFSALETAFPQADAAELRRFARARPKGNDALKTYKSYRLWRSGEGQPALLEQGLAAMPECWIEGSAVCGLAKDGTGIVFVEGARYDTSVPVHAYTQAVCRTVDMMLPDSSEGQITALLDVRPGRGWPNPSPRDIIPFIRDLVKTVMSNYPERLKRLMVYPLPASLVTFANFLLMVMDASLRQKIQLVPDRDFVDHLREHVTTDNIPERARSRHPGL
eukprot:TRINITY_DN100657_c0_g1_i1.p1 TRINITY_DN100657_c0_g1~~TRINITY_DN100657_c0_g1_i1.p1  ORF type:complete len:369 (-),score=65.53 TRINITY_DN100657_c0_g1_i1:117-1223(-)